MQIAIDSKKYKIPGSLMDVTLAQRIEFDKKHGKDLRAQLKKIIEMKDGPLREIEFTTYHCELACKTLSFFGNIPLDVVENTQIEEVLAVYHTSMKLIGEDTDFTNAEFELMGEFEWNGETWMIAAPDLKYNSVMTFGEFLDAKQWIKNLWELSEEKWEALLMLACVYFRKKDEKYSDVLSAEGGERYQLLKTLPLQYALHIGFFLAVSMSSFLKTFHSSLPMIPSELELQN